VTDRAGSTAASRSGIDTPAMVRERLEREARHVSRSAALDPERTLAPARRLEGSPAGRAEDARLVPGIGTRAKLSGGDDIFIHEDEAAAREAESIGARAFAYGNHVVVGREVRPDTPEGRKVIAHEVAHTIQQAQPGAESAVQRDPSEGQGIGRQPPAENYVSMPGETGSEDDFVLFQRDAAQLDLDGMGKLRTLFQQYTSPVTVHVHGYASREGDAEYNMNLSAHRAVAVRRFIESLLPQGSVVVLYAHGDVSEFGARSANRRVGVDVIERGPAARHEGGNLSFPSLTLGLGLDLTLRPPAWPGVPPPNLDVTTLPPTSILTPPSDVGRPNYFLTPPSIVPPYDMGGPAAAYTARGVPYSDRDARGYQQHYNFWVQNYVRLGLSPDRAAWLAQLGTDTAASFQLSVEYPTQFEQLDRALGTEPTTVPVLNDAMMRWLFEKFRD
jgi:outer membrane protein OmpA-like peptidoglycan-associated protein